MKRLGMHLLLAAWSLAVAACASSTMFDTTWKSPDAKPLHLRGRNVAAVFVSRDPILRRVAEDAMVHELNARGVVGIASYTFVSDSAVRDTDAVRAKADELGCVAAAVMRIAGRETQTRFEPAEVMNWPRPPYRRLWGDYWGWGWGTVRTPGYLREDRIVKIETLIYSLEDDDLVWAGVSKTFEPFEIEMVVSETAVAVSHALERDGLIEPRS